MGSSKSNLLPSGPPRSVTVQFPCQTSPLDRKSATAGPFLGSLRSVMTMSFTPSRSKSAIATDLPCFSPNGLAIDLHSHRGLEFACATR